MSEVDADGYVCTIPSKMVQKGRGRSVLVNGERFALFKVDGKIYATQAKCPHAGAGLYTGTMSGEVVICPRHQWKFNVRTGACLRTDTFCLRRYPVRIKSGRVWVNPNAIS